MGLKHVPLINIVSLLPSILTNITLSGESLNGRVRCLGFWLRATENAGRFYHGNQSYFLFRKLSKINSFLMSLFPAIITKEILERIVALTSFVGMIATIVARR
jgi:hypothetical protein